MGDRIASDHPSILTFRSRVESAGATGRPRLVLPPDASEHVPSGVVRLVVDGSSRHAAVRSTTDGMVISGAYASPRLARSSGMADNQLAMWLDAAGVAIGRSVLFDVVVPDVLYGVRLPGTTTVYDAIEPPSASLSRIADGLEE